MNWGLLLSRGFKYLYSELESDNSEIYGNVKKFFDFLRSIQLGKYTDKIYNINDNLVYFDQEVS